MIVLDIIQTFRPEIHGDFSAWPQVLTVRCKDLPAGATDWWNGIIVHKFVEDLRCTVKNESGKVNAALAINKSVRIYRFDAMATPGEELISLQEGTFDVSKQEDLTAIERMLNYVMHNGLQRARAV